MKENPWAWLLAYVTGLVNQELLLKRAPVPASGCQTCPEEPIRSGQFRSLYRSLQDVELMAKREKFNLVGPHGGESNPAPLPKWPISLKPE